MGKKYIIELEDKPFHKGNGDFLYRVKGFNSLVFDMTGVGKLTPYTEPDLEQVRKEAYKDGYDAGFGRKIDASYHEGLADAWEAARKIASDNAGRNYSIFGQHFTVEILNTHSASECIEKIRQYEQEKEEIKVGDEVTTASGKAVVTGVGPVHFEYVYADGSHGYDEVKNVTKTGRHFPEIAAVLEKIRGE